MIFLALLFIVWVFFGPLARFLDRRDFSRWLARWKREGCSYNDSGTRTVFPSGYSWEVREQDNGDRDILPLGEDHGRGPGCSCNPRVDVEGGYLVTVHNSFDHREIVEEAINIMNGVDNAESG